MFPGFCEIFRGQFSALQNVVPAQTSDSCLGNGVLVFLETYYFPGISIFSISTIFRILSGSRRATAQETHERSSSDSTVFFTTKHAVGFIKFSTSRTGCCLLTPTCVFLNQAGGLERTSMCRVLPDSNMLSRLYLCHVSFCIGDQLAAPLFGAESPLVIWWGLGGLFTCAQHMFQPSENFLPLSSAFNKTWTLLTVPLCAFFPHVHAKFYFGVNFSFPIFVKSPITFFFNP